MLLELVSDGEWTHDRELMGSLRLHLLRLISRT